MVDVVPEEAIHEQESWELIVLHCTLYRLWSEQNRIVKMLARCEMVFIYVSASRWDSSFHTQSAVNLHPFRHVS
jgi:hypothetical protein